MNFCNISIAILVFMFFAQCSKHDTCKHEPATDMYLVGLKYCIGEHEYLQIKSIDDSRCPRETDCFWEGKTDIYIDLFAHNTLHDAILTIPNTEEPVLIKDIFGYDITVLNIAPFPNKDTRIKQSEYVVRMNVKAL